METIEFLDKITPIYGDNKDLKPPYIGGGHNRHLKGRTYTEEILEAIESMENKSFAKIGVLIPHFDLKI